MYSIWNFTSNGNGMGFEKQEEYVATMGISIGYRH